jgi:cell division protein FtsI/penicillin-binding protein 2
MLALLALLALLCPGKPKAGLPASIRSLERADASEPDPLSLFAQSAAEKLDGDLNRPEISFLLLDASSGKLLASGWKRADTKIPMGSLVKPFTTLSYGEQHNYKYPVYTCRGAATHCWVPRGHGEVNLTKAIAYSCNAYFRMLAGELGTKQVSVTAARFGLEPPADNTSKLALIGIGDQWAVSPINMARAYLELVQRRNQRGVREILDGMATSAQKGTGAAINRSLEYDNALVKTGTAPCAHHKRAPGDGFVVTLIPANQPRILLLVRVHGVPGAQAAETAGAMLRRIGE